MKELEGIGKLKKFYDLMGIRPRDLPACTIVLQQCSRLLSNAASYLPNYTDKTLKMEALSSSVTVVTNHRDTRRLNLYSNNMRQIYNYVPGCFIRR
jgi:hypothetical protein